MSNRDKILRQLNIYFNIRTTEYHGPSELIRRFGISKRTLHRDLDDLKDSGLLKLKYDRKHDNYVMCNRDGSFLHIKKGSKRGAKRTVPIAPVPIAPRRQQHLTRLYRLGTLIFSLTPTDTEAVSAYYYDLEMYHFYFDELMKEDPEKYTIDEAPDKPELPDIADLKSEYYSLFPDSSERTRQRDFETLTRAGFPIHFDRRINRYIYEL
jgi:DNA-binding transcriptional ArsR family regulator